MNQFIPLSVPNLKGNELEYVSDAVRGEWVSTAGSYVSRFEEEMAKYLGIEKAVACQSGTAGLHVALQLCGVSGGDLVIVPTLTFIAAVNPVKYLGAEPVFMDCDDSLCLDAVKLEAFCQTECELRENQLYHRATGKRIPALVVVHVFGNMANMEAILEIAENYHLKIVEDATEALGTKYTQGKYEGMYAGTMGDFGVYSFNGNKIITTGGGGMIVAKKEDEAAHAKHLTQQAKSDEVRFEHDEIGYNYRMTNLQAALALAQLEPLESFIANKKENYMLYRSQVGEMENLSILDFRTDIRPNYWFYCLYIGESFPLGREALMQHFQQHQIQTRPIWGLIHEQKPYQGSLCYQIERAHFYQEAVLNLPCSSNLSKQDVERVLQVLRHLEIQDGEMRA